MSEFCDRLDSDEMQTCRKEWELMGYNVQTVNLGGNHYGVIVWQPYDKSSAADPGRQGSSGEALRKQAIYRYRPENGDYLRVS